MTLRNLPQRRPIRRRMPKLHRSGPLPEQKPLKKNPKIEYFKHQGVDTATHASSEDRCCRSSRESHLGEFCSSFTGRDHFPSKSLWRRIRETEHCKPQEGDTVTYARSEDRCGEGSCCRRSRESHSEEFCSCLSDRNRFPSKSV